MKKLLALFIVLSILVPVVFAQEAGEKGKFTWSGAIRAEYYAADTALGTSGMTGDSGASVTLTYNKDIVTLFGTLGGAFTAGSTTLMSPYATFGASATNDLFKVNLALKNTFGLNFPQAILVFLLRPLIRSTAGSTWFPVNSASLRPTRALTKPFGVPPRLWIRAMTTSMTMAALS